MPIAELERVVRMLARVELEERRRSLGSGRSAPT
jgi:hypothetical protein